MAEKDHLTIREFEQHANYVKESFNDIKLNMEKAFNKIDSKLDNLSKEFVTKEEFLPIKEDIQTAKETIRNMIFAIIASLASGIIGLGSYIWHLIIR